MTEWWDWRVDSWRCLQCDELEPCGCTERARILAELAVLLEAAGYKPCGTK